MTKYKVTHQLTKEEYKLLRIYMDYYGMRKEETALRVLANHGLREFLGTNTGNPDIPELDTLDLNKL